MVGVEEEGSCCEVEQRMRKEGGCRVVDLGLVEFEGLDNSKAAGEAGSTSRLEGGFEGEQILACDAWNCTFCLSSSSCSFLIFSLVFQRIFHCKMDHSCKGFVQSELDTSSIHSLE